MADPNVTQTAQSTINAVKEHVDRVHESLSQRLDALDKAVDKPAQAAVNSHLTPLILIAWTIGCIAIGAHFF